MLGVTVPSKLIKIDDELVFGMERLNFQKLMACGQHRVTFGLGKPIDTMKAIDFLKVWQDLNRNLRLPAEEPRRAINTQEDGHGGFYHICLPRFADARRLYVLGLEFLFDHIHNAMRSSQKKHLYSQTSLQDWAQAAAVWPSESEVRNRISQMKSSNV